MILPFGWQYALAAVTVWVLVELLFYLWFCRALRKAQVIQRGPSLTIAEMDRLLERSINRPNALEMIAGWLRSGTTNAVNSAILNRENIVEILAANFFAKKVDELKLSEEEWCNRAVDKLCIQHGYTLSSQSNDYKCMKHLVDPVVASWRPFFFYLGIMTLQSAVGVLLRLRGYTRSSAHGVHYWYYGTSNQTLLNAQAMVFFHGVGIGLPSYVSLLCNGITFAQQFVFESPSITMNPFAAPITSTTMVLAVEEVFKRHRVDKATFVGHSFGSVYTSWVYHYRPELVQRMVLIDPVAILLCFPDVCYSFLYKDHATWHGKFVNQMASMELGISTTIRRHLHFSESCLFPDMLPPDSVVLLSEYDHIVPTREIYVNMCKTAHKSVQTVVMSKMQHGMAFVYREKRRLIVDAINGDLLNHHDLMSKM